MKIFYEGDTVKMDQDRYRDIRIALELKIN